MEDVLTRPKFASKLAASMLTADQLVVRYAELAIVVRPLPVPRIAPDPDDDVVIGTALAARADCLVTGDGALLSVGAYETVRITGVADTLAMSAHPEP